MTKLYHLKPRNMVGDILYPLNQMRETQPDVYEQGMKKYEGREVLMERRIPLLNCLWNDAMFFSNAHPKAIRDAFLAVGKTWKPQLWFEIDTDELGFTEDNTVIYYPRMNREKGDFSVRVDDFVQFDPKRVPTIDTLPDAVMTYYRDAVANDERIFVWMGLPHILHQGSIHTDDMTLITV